MSESNITGDDKSQSSNDVLAYEQLDPEMMTPLAEIVTGARSYHSSHIRDRSNLPTIGGDKPFPPDPGSSLEYQVDFDGPDDPTHPHNWPKSKKIPAAFSLALTTMSLAWNSAIFAPTIPSVAVEFEVSQEVAILGITLFILGFSISPIVYGSLSEMFGRKALILVSQFGLIVFTFACATAKDLQTVLLSRFFSGFTGSAPFAVIGGAFSDMYSAYYRGTAIAVYVAAVFVGPILSPLVGAFITESYLGWRWALYISAFFACFSWVLNMVLYEETYYPVILKAKARRLRQETGNWAIHALAERQEIDMASIIRKTVIRPIKMLTTQPIVFLIGIYVSFVYGILYMCLEVFPLIFVENYGMSPAIGQLPYIAVLVGILGGCSYLLMLEPRYRRKVLLNDGKVVPEARLEAMYLPAVIFPIGLFWLTWTGSYPEKIHWIVPTIGGGFVGFGLIGVFVSSIQFLIESYLMLAASVMASNTFVRSAFAASFPLFSTQMFHGMGIQYAGTLLGCVALVLLPIPFLFRRYASRLKSTIKFVA